MMRKEKRLTEDLKLSLVMMITEIVPFTLDLYCHLLPFII